MTRFDGMTDEEMGQLLSLIEGLFECKGKSFPASVKQLFIVTLNPLPYFIARKIVIQKVLELPYLPCPADIWQMAIDLADEQQPAFAAWEKVRSECGRERPDRLRERVFHAVMDLGGLKHIWHRLQYSGEKESVIRADFITAYQAQIDRYRQFISDDLLRPREERAFGWFGEAEEMHQAKIESAARLIDGKDGTS